MQVSGQVNLTDRESVEKGVAKMLGSWNLQNSVSVSRRLRNVIADFNRDSDYLSNVLDLMEIISKRVDSDFEPEFEGINYFEYWSGKSDAKKPSANIQSLKLKLRARKY
jgi:hypothetical protein